MDELHVHTENICSMTVTSPTAVGDFYQLGHLKGTVYTCFGGCRLGNPRLLLWKQLNITF